ncbi:hypothetical protein [Tenacibaculum xiamenense]|uniref:hypothetical protein n=1 Tax=Tenacibaculum xiamenense TaxID=1261553 RepID=UPI0038949975
MNNHKIGGYSAITEAFLYVIGFTYLVFFLSPGMEGLIEDIDKLEFVLNNKTLFQVWNLLIYVLFGIILIPLTIVINDNFNKNSLMASKVAPILGFIWSGLVIASGMVANVGLESIATIFATDKSSAVTVWKTIDAIQGGLGGGIEVVGGLWVFFISYFGIKQRVFSKFLNYLGLIVGVAGIASVFPGLSDLGAIFGLTQIVWFAWIGIVLLKKREK